MGFIYHVWHIFAVFRWGWPIGHLHGVLLLILLLLLMLHLHHHLWMSHVGVAHHSVTHVHLPIGTPHGHPGTHGTHAVAHLHSLLHHHLLLMLLLLLLLLLAHHGTDIGRGGHLKKQISQFSFCHTMK